MRFQPFLEVLLPQEHARAMQLQVAQLKKRIDLKLGAEVVTHQGRLKALARQAAEKQRKINELMVNAPERSIYFNYITYFYYI